MSTATAPRLPAVQTMSHEPDPDVEPHTFTQPGPFGTITRTQVVCLHCRRRVFTSTLDRCPSRTPGPTPLDPNLMDYRPGRRGGRELWGAISGDRQWAYIREESAGTHWHIEHLPTERVLTFAAPTILTAQKMTADGTALALLDQQRIVVAVHDHRPEEVVAP